MLFVGLAVLHLKVLGNDSLEKQLHIVIFLTFCDT